MTNSPAIDVHDLRKQYKEGWIFKKGFLALKGVDLTVNRGEVFGLLGPNGAGKTTLIKILLGIVRSTGGTAQLLGDPAGSKSARRKIGYLPENLSFPSHHTAKRSLELYGRLSGVSESEIRTRGGELLERVGLLGREREFVRKYSKGMRQRLGLAQSMLHKPELMILDEPTDGLDPVGRSEIRRIIMQLKEEGKTVFLNSHILQEVELVCDRVAILAEGQLRGVGTPAELKQQFESERSTKLRLELSGEPAEIEKFRSAIPPRFSDVTSQELPDSLWHFTISVESQAEDRSQADIDQLVDLVRQHGISLRKLERTRLTLEEVFLSAVQGEEADSSPAPALSGESA